MARKERNPINPLVAIGDATETPGLDGIRAYSELSGQGRGVALVMVVGAEGSVPRGLGAAMAVREDGSIVGTVGGGNLELLLIDHALEAMKDGRARRYHYDFTGGPESNIQKSCVGKSEFFVLPSVPRPKLYVFGAGHIGSALAPMAQQSGFKVTVIDDREGYHALANLDDQVTVMNMPFADAVMALSFDESTYVVLVTYGHATDALILDSCLLEPWRYMGMIGSKSKVSRMKRDLGTSDERKQRLAEIHAPIGLDIGGREPAEIAVSILAELIASRYRPEKEDA